MRSGQIFTGILWVRMYRQHYLTVYVAIQKINLASQKIGALEEGKR